MNKTLIVYLNQAKTSFIKITPSNQFEAYDPKYKNLSDRCWRELAEGLTNSFPKKGIINYHSFDVI